RQVHHGGCFVVGQGRMLMKQQDKPKALDRLDGHRSATDGIEGLLHECYGKSTKSGSRSWHRGFLSMLGIWGSSPPSTRNAQQPRRYLRNGPLSNCTLSGNSAHFGGGGLFSRGM